jgi:hypothetical protein
VKNALILEWKRNFINSAIFTGTTAKFYSDLHPPRSAKTKCSTEPPSMQKSPAVFSSFLKEKEKSKG